ncbi:hypothetical protein [Streptomyces sp. NBC_01506]|uniref:hypothetical protein n=1 Tax=Streptomyces sp. NBC_01506 TaxID=2903887 RepID=UPI003870C386
MGLLPTVLISLVFPALMLFVMVALGRMEEILLPHLQAPRPESSEGEAEAPAEDSRTQPGGEDARQPVSDAEAEDDAHAEGPHAEQIRIANARADIARARAEALRRSARRRAYGTPRPVGRTNTGPPRGARTTPLRFR